METSVEQPTRAPGVMMRGLSSQEVTSRRQESGFNEVTERKPHPVWRLLRQFWGLSAWMLEIIMGLSLALRKYSDLAVALFGFALAACLGVNDVLKVALIRWRVPSALEVDAEALR